MTWMGEGTADSNGPYAYARKLAYLGDAPKVRARTKDAFGKAPPLSTCQRFVDERKQQFERFKTVSVNRAALRG